MTVFVMLATTGIMLLSEVAKISREVEMKEYLYTEVQATMEKMSRIIQDSAIDYEEYYSRIIVQSGDISGEPFGDSSTYGDYYGFYHAQFFDGTGNETGINPAGGTDNTANAMCEGTPNCSDNTTLHEVTELYLIDGSGTEKTLFVLEQDDIDGNSGLAMLKMDGYKHDQDSDGFIDAWVCASDYDCTGEEILDPDTGGIIGSHPDPNDRIDDRDSDNFIPITPSKLHIDELHFYLAPIEDPFKAFAEDQSSASSTETMGHVQIHPNVIITIVASYVDNGIVGPSMTTQTSISTGVYHKIPTADDYNTSDNDPALASYSDY